jgi:hypothetical protein
MFNNDTLSGAVDGSRHKPKRMAHTRARLAPSPASPASSLATVQPPSPGYKLPQTRQHHRRQRFPSLYLSINRGPQPDRDRPERTFRHRQNTAVGKRPVVRRRGAFTRAHGGRQRVFDRMTTTPPRRIEAIVVIARFDDFRNNTLRSAWLWADCA